MKRKIAVTGGNGFIGKTLIAELLKRDVSVVSLQRSAKKLEGVEIRHFDLSKLDKITSEMLLDVDVVVHTAALVHNIGADEAEHTALNFEATKRLFDACKAAKVDKFVFISTLGVYGINSTDKKISIETKTAPISAYANSKLKCEEILFNCTSQLNVSVLRLPLVYGTDAPGNYGAIEKLAKTKLPLPFLNVRNKRSMVNVETVAKVLSNIAVHTDMYLGLHILAEKEPYSTEEIVTQIRLRSKNRPLLFPVPPRAMKLLLSLIGKKKMYEQLYENLECVSTIEDIHITQ